LDNAIVRGNGQPAAVRAEAEVIDIPGVHGRIAPLDGVGPEHLTVERLLQRVRAGGIQEIIMGTNPTTEGDGTALYLSSVLAPLGVRITRLARGLPSGSVLEFANNQMLADALDGRRAFFSAEH
jgi:recombination protein RecR